MKTDTIQKILASRAYLLPSANPLPYRKIEAEGGCGVIGAACAEKIKGKHLLSALVQMRNRGNGKGGGIAAAGLSAEYLGVSQEILDNDYLLAIAYLDRKSQPEVEKDFIHPVFEIDHVHEMDSISDFQALGLDVKPPEVLIYFVRVKQEAAQAFQEKHQLNELPQASLEDELVYQNSYRLNRSFYASAGEKRAFVLSHGKNLLVLKMVSFGDDVIRYYKLEDLPAHVWIGHHRYPTKGKVWHPGGAHPFIGMHEALVHNGDFANYFSICEYLSQRNIYPLFLTDTEVAALAFDLFYRTYKYPLEYVIEAFAPTTERDFTLLPEQKQHIYQAVQKTHMHGSPDGPWFFLLAQTIPVFREQSAFRLIGITDTSMLRPQVFALQKGEVPIGFAASEKQAIDAALKSLSEDDGRFWTHADYYWNARGGSHTDGGAFVFTVQPQAEGQAHLTCSDKFGNQIYPAPLKPAYIRPKVVFGSYLKFPDLSSPELLDWIKQKMAYCTYDETRQFLTALIRSAKSELNLKRAIEVVTKLIDQHYFMEHMRRSSLLTLLDRCLSHLVEFLSRNPTGAYAFLECKRPFFAPESGNQTLVVDARGFPAEGEHSLAQAIVQMYHLGFKKFMVVHCSGQRFLACGLGPKSHGVTINVYGSSGDYIGSGIDGAEVVVHGSAQDQAAQIMKEGTLIVYGDVGQTFMYGAKGGKAFVRGNAAGRPLINAVGKPRVVINGTCLDYLAESFMAGNPRKGGGFVIVNGIFWDEQGEIKDLETPYPGGNLFSLASGGAIYMRDPHQVISEEQLNGGEFVEMTSKDWALILPYLEENAAIFGLPVVRLLQSEGRILDFAKVYRKIAPAHNRILLEEEAWVKGKA